MTLKEIWNYIFRFFKKLVLEQKKTKKEKVRRIVRIKRRKSAVPSASPQSNNNINKGALKNKGTLKMVSFFFVGLIFSFGCLLFSGCSKNQDVKIVHNYWDGKVDYTERKKQSTLDLWVYKNYKDIYGKNKSLMYKVD